MDQGDRWREEDGRGGEGGHKGRRSRTRDVVVVDAGVKESIKRVTKGNKLSRGTESHRIVGGGAEQRQRANNH